MSEEIQRIFRDAADLAPEERAAFFAGRRVSEGARAEVESLLRHDARGSDGLTAVVDGTIEEFLQSQTTEETRRCGPWQLDRPIGRGGMGTVFLAHREDGEVEQQAAIKLIRNAAEDPEFRERFLRERQILASLNHPGIARLMDAGHTAAGQPWFAMEYVEGTPIDVFARDLDLRAKLELVLLAMEAIEFAHRNLVIHRDLKPSNMLVNAAGQPKLLDFGIARILDSEASGVTRDRALTPGFASPEQVMGAARTTATDIYSLAAVLYELVAGRNPYGAVSSRNPNETMERLICFFEPPPPSRFNPSLPRDLDFILAKALRKEPEARYSSIEAFGVDLRALLDSRPVRARAGNAWYVAAKLIRRRWLPAGSVAVAVFSLAAGLYVANRERETAQDRFRKLRQLANKLVLLDSGTEGLPTQKREEIVAASAEYLDELSRDARGDGDLALEVARGYLKTAEVEGVPAFPGLGHFAAAEKSLKDAGVLTGSVLAREPHNKTALLLEGGIEQDLMMVTDTMQHEDDALAHARRCAASLDSLLRYGAPSQVELRDISRSYENIGLAFLNLHRLSEATEYARKGVELGRSTGAPADYLAIGLSLLANAQRQAGDLDGALRSVAEARRMAEQATFATEIRKGSALYTILWREGLILGEDAGVSLGRTADAIEPLEGALAQVDRLAAKDPADATSRDRVATASRSLGDILWHTNPRRALQVFDHAISRQRELKDNPMARTEETILLARSSYPLRALGRQSEARARIDAAMKLLPAGTSGEGAKNAVMRALADYQSETQPALALTTLRELLRNAMAAKPGAGEDLGRANGISTIYAGMAKLEARRKHTAEARELNSQRAELWRNWDRKLPGNPFVARQLAASAAELP